MVYLRVVIVDVPELLTLRNQLPLVDVRSEGEFEQGHIPAALNIPILNNAERVIVGTAYKQLGQAHAIKEGFRLVGPRLLDIISASEQVGKEFIVHCWRGGMRSGNFCQFVSMAGMKTHQVRGGYKAYRQYALRSFAKNFKFMVIAGFTGSGKTEILRTLKDLGEQVIDLEGLAKHKGSVFGGLGQPAQPTTEQFQNLLFEELHKMNVDRRIWIEDESIAIGKIFLPGDFWNTMGRSPIIAVEVSKEVRTERLVREYGVVDREQFVTALNGITRKLGGQHYTTAVEQLKVGNMSAAIDIILNYYDKAYNNGLERKKDRVKLTLNWNGSSVEDFARTVIEEARSIEASVFKFNYQAK